MVDEFDEFGLEKTTGRSVGKSGERKQMCENNIEVQSPSVAAIGL